MSPADLEEIVGKNTDNKIFSDLLVGNDSKDDAAVYDLGNGEAIISTTDFFTPIVDDPYDFGRIASVNAISDIYAMGGTPLMAIAILGWPLDKLPKEEASKVLEGARAVCKEAGIPLAGGHSIDIADPIFGLSVTGRIKVNNIKKNNEATAGCKLFITKPIGIGIVTTAEKNDIIRTSHREIVIDLMTSLNSIGPELASIDGVKAMTDVTGYGLLGHLLEICKGSNVSAKLFFKSIPMLEDLDFYIEKKSIPGGTFKNWKSYGHEVSLQSPDQKLILCDPQTSGGLLIAVETDSVEKVHELAKKNNTKLFEIGELKKRDLKGEYIYVK